MIKLTKFLAPPPAFRSVLSFGAFQQLLITLLVHLYPRNRRIVPPPERVTHDVLPHLSSEEKSGGGFRVEQNRDQKCINTNRQEIILVLYM